MKKRLSMIVRTAVSIGLIALLLYIMRGQYGQIVATLSHTNPAVFLLAVAVFVGAITLAAYRLCLIVRAQEIPITFPEAASLTFIGYFFNNFLPTAIGGDVVKGYYLSRKTDQKTGAYTAVFVDRALGLFTMILMAFVAILFAERSVVDESIRRAIFIIMLVSAIGMLFLLHKGFAKKFSFFLRLVRPLEHKLRRVYDSIHHYRHYRLLLVKSITISVASQLCYFSMIGIIALSIGSRISIGNILLRMPIISAMSLIPSINGLGVREGATVLLFAPLIGKEQAFAISILLLAALFAISIIGGIVYLLSPQYRVNLREVSKR